MIPLTSIPTRELQFAYLGTFYVAEGVVQRWGLEHVCIHIDVHKNIKLRWTMITPFKHNEYMNTYDICMKSVW